MNDDLHPAPVDPRDTGALIGWIRDVFRQVGLAWRLFWDKRVSFWTKLIPPAAIAYVLSPIDIISDWPPIGLNQLDDVAILLLGIKLFIELFFKYVPQMSIHYISVSIAA